MGESFDYFRLCIGSVMLRKKKDRERVITRLIPHLVVGGNLMQTKV